MHYSYFYIGFQFILLFQFFFGIAQYFVNRRIEYAYYAFYLLLLVIYSHAMWSTFGVGLEELKFSIGVEPFFDKPVITLSFYMYYRFARYFLEIPNKLPLLNKRIKRIEYVLLGYVVLEILLLGIWGDRMINEIIFHVLSTFNLLMGVWCVISFLKQRRTPLNYFILAGGSLIIVGGITSLILIISHPLEMMPVLFVFPIFVLLEIFVFTTGLAFKSRLLEKHKLESEKKLVTELKTKESLQQNIAELRNKIARDLHDDLGSTLGSLGIYAEAAKKNMDINDVDKARNILEKMSQLSTDTLKNLREMVWIITPGNEKWKDLNDRIENYGKNVLSAKQITFSTQSSIEEKLELSMIQRRNLYLIFKECIHNVLKHSNANQVNFNAEFNHYGNFVFSIEDNGTDKTGALKENGYGLKNLRMRSEELNGSIKLGNDENSGFRVTVEFPINKN